MSDQTSSNSFPHPRREEIPGGNVRISGAWAGHKEGTMDSSI